MGRRRRGRKDEVPGWLEKYFEGGELAWCFPTRCTHVKEKGRGYCICAKKGPLISLEVKDLSGKRNFVDTAKQRK